jgi:transitional endoplasmic reticulum ATPase
LDAIHALSDIPNANVPRMFLLSGPPGVGKTHAVRSAIQAARVPMFTSFLRGSDISSSSSGDIDSSLLSLEKHLVHAQRESQTKLCLLFWDEFDALVSSSEVHVGILVHHLDRIAHLFPRIIVIAATNLVDSIPQSLRRAGRLEYEVLIQPPSSDQRQTILHSMMDDPIINLKEIADMTVGFVPADLHALVRKAKMRNLRNDKESMEKSLLYSMESVQASVSLIFPIIYSYFFSDTNVTLYIKSSPPCL